MTRQKPRKEPHVPPTLDDKGHEVLDNTPVAIPVRFKGMKAGLTEEVQRAMLYLSMEAQFNDQESFEEADDFDVPGDNDFFSPHEIDNEQESYDAARDERWFAGSETTAGNGDGNTPQSIQPSGPEAPTRREGPTTSERSASDDPPRPPKA